MKHENSESKKKVTLDTNCLINLLQKKDKAIKEDFEKNPKTSENTTKVYKEESVTRSKSKSSKERYKAVKKIIDLHEQGMVDVKVTTRVEFDQRNCGNKENKEALLNLAQKLGIIPSVFRYGGFSRYGSISNHSSGDGYGSITSLEMEKKLKKIMFGVKSFDAFTKETTKYRKIADVDHLLAHIIEKRDYFVTSDEKDFIKNGKREKLKSEFGVEIMTPEEFVKMYEDT